MLKRPGKMLQEAGRQQQRTEQVPGLRANPLAASRLGREGKISSCPLFMPASKAVRSSEGLRAHWKRCVFVGGEIAVILVFAARRGRGVGRDRDPDLY
jgi:hypothetical protein